MAYWSDGQILNAGSLHNCLRYITAGAGSSTVNTASTDICVATAPANTVQSGAILMADVYYTAKRNTTNETEGTAKIKVIESGGNSEVKDITFDTATLVDVGNQGTEDDFTVSTRGSATFFVHHENPAHFGVNAFSFVLFGSRIETGTISVGNFMLLGR